MIPVSQSFPRDVIHHTVFYKCTSSKWGGKLNHLLNFDGTYSLITVPETTEIGQLLLKISYKVGGVLFCNTVYFSSRLNEWILQKSAFKLFHTVVRRNTTLLVKKYLQTSMRLCCTNNFISCPRVLRLPYKPVLLISIIRYFISVQQVSPESSTLQTFQAQLSQPVTVTQTVATGYEQGCRIGFKSQGFRFKNLKTPI